MVNFPKISYNLLQSIIKDYNHFFYQNIIWKKNYYNGL